jgi:hypothetical protein
MRDSFGPWVNPGRVQRMRKAAGGYGKLECIKHAELYPVASFLIGHIHKKCSGNSGYICECTAVNSMLTELSLLSWVNPWWNNMVHGDAPG